MSQSELCRMIGKKSAILCLSVIFLIFQSIYGQTPPQITTLELNKPLERELSGIQKHSYQITLTSNQYTKILIEQHGIDIEAQLFAPDGKSILNFDSELRVNEKENVEFVAQTEGQYRLDVKSKYKNAAGRFEIRLMEIRPANDRDKATFQVRQLIAESNELYYFGKYSEAFPLAVRALEIAEKELGADNALVAYLLEQTGRLQQAKNNYPEAEALLQRALATNKKVLGTDHPQTLSSMNRLGLIYFYSNQYTKTDQLWHQSMEITERTLGPENPNIIVILSYLANFLSGRDDAQAERLLQRALAISEKSFLKENYQTGSILSALADIYRDQKNYEKAEQTYKRALSVYEQTIGAEHNAYSNTLQNLGVMYRERKDYDGALKIYEQALVIREKQLGADHPNVAALLNNIANIYRSKGDYAKALEIQQRVFSNAEKNAGPYHGLTFISLSNISRIYLALGDTANALSFRKILEQRTELMMNLELSVGSERQKLGYFESISLANDRTISLHVNFMPDNQSACDLAALILLQRKGRVLDSISDGMKALRQRSNDEDRKLLDQLQTATEQLAKFSLKKSPEMSNEEYQKQLVVLGGQKDKLEADISRRSAEFRIQTQTATLKTIQAEIPENAALIEFAVYRPFFPKAEISLESYGEPRYVAYILRNQGEVEWKDLGKVKEINEKIDLFRQALRDPQRKDTQQIARTLDEKIMSPIRSLLGATKHLLISPDGNLNLIPFEALVDEQNRFLLENYSFTYLTSGRDLLGMQTLRTNKSKPLVIANPAFGEPDSMQTVAGKRQSITTTRNLSDTYFAPLGGTIQEARSIQTLFPEAETLTEKQATETTLKQINAPKILHIATHGFFLEDGDKKLQTENPLLRSGLALAGANQRKRVPDDGILTALEASGLNLWGTKLVVLSACDTGLGEVKNGEGVYGLRRAFVLAGTESLVMSLWSVSDLVTRELMTSYYKNLKQGMGRGEALRQTQLEMLKKPNRRHPFYWASFIQSGDWTGLESKK